MAAVKGGFLSKLVGLANQFARMPGATAKVSSPPAPAAVDPGARRIA